MKNEWMSISDMMSGLMLVFLFIAISFMMNVEAQKEQMQDVARSYRDTKADLNEALMSEFENDLTPWNATITKDNSIVFASPEVLFGVSSSKINDKFKVVLKKFFARYVKILTSKEFKDEIKEVRVEGYTSKSWKSTNSPKEIYLKNMQLSQERAYNVLAYCYSLDDAVVDKNREWLEQHLRANGMAFSNLKDIKTARRVEFRVNLQSENKLIKIIKKNSIRS